MKTSNGTKLRKFQIVVDVVMIVIFALLPITGAVSVETHGLLGIMIILIVLLHLALNWKWLKAVITKIHNRQASKKSRKRLFYVMGLVITLTITIISGILLANGLDDSLISQELSTNSTENIVPKEIVHRLSTVALMVFIILHIRVHIKRK